MQDKTSWPFSKEENKHLLFPKLMEFDLKTILSIKNKKIKYQNQSDYLLSIVQPKSNL